MTKKTTTEQTKKHTGKTKPGMERSLSQGQVVDAAFRMIDEHGYGKFSCVPWPIILAWEL